MAHSNLGHQNILGFESSDLGSHYGPSDHLRRQTLNYHSGNLQRKKHQEITMWLNEVQYNIQVLVQILGALTPFLCDVKLWFVNGAIQYKNSTILFDAVKDDVYSE